MTDTVRVDVRTIEDKLDDLAKTLRSMGSVAVAYSGGTDSSLLLKVAHDVMGDRAVGFMAISPSFPEHERNMAREVAESIGAKLVEIVTDEMNDESFVQNDRDRCYHCKRTIIKRIKEEMAPYGLSVVIDGNNADDAGSGRYGLKAMKEEGGRSPLAEVGLSKEEVRQLSRLLELPNADKPSSACLASRIPFGVRITEGNLRMVEMAESFLRSLGIEQLRVRYHGDTARIEVEEKDFQIVIENRAKISEEFRTIGFTFVALDIDGFRSGSMESSLKD